MQETIHRFARFLRLAGVRISVAEVIDAVAAMAQPGVLNDRETLREALLVALIKDRRDRESFDAVFTAFFLPAAGLDVQRCRTFLCAR